MWHESLFVSDCAEDFLCVSIADKPDIEASTYFLEPRVAVEMNAIRELPFFRSVNKLVLLPGELSEPCTPYLRDCPATELKIDYYTDVIDDYTIDISAMQQLRYVFSRSLYGFCNVKQATHLKAIKVGQWNEPDFLYLKGANLAAIQILSGKIQDMSGIQQLRNLQFLSVANCPRIKDFSMLGECVKLESLILESCGTSIATTMPVISSLKYLNLRTASIPNAAWFDRFPNLSYLVLDTRIADGQINRLQRRKHCVLITDRQHYSLRNNDLPKSGTVLPNDSYHYELNG